MIQVDDILHDEIVIMSKFPLNITKNTFKGIFSLEPLSDHQSYYNNFFPPKKQETKPGIFF
jgi:hypothetical protein